MDQSKSPEVLRPEVLIMELYRSDLDMIDRRFCLIVPKGPLCDVTGVMRQAGSINPCLDREAPSAGLTLAKSGSLRSLGRLGSLA